MKLRGAHIVVLVAAAVVGLLVYGGARMAGQSSDTQPAADPEDKFLEQVRETAPVTPSTEAGTVPPMGSPAGKAPRIELEPNGDINMGTIRNDGKTTIEVKVHNKGDATLKINKLGVGCGCTQAKMEEKDKTIAPGTFSPLSITVDPARIAAGFESRKAITINSNDPTTPALKFDVIVKVNPEYQLEPAEVDFGEVEKGKPYEQTILLRQLTDQPIEVKSVNPTMLRYKSLDLSFELRPKEQWLDQNKAEYNIKVKLADNVPLGRFQGRFTIMTTCKRRAEVPVSVKANVKSWYAMSPAMVVVRASADPAASSKTVVTADRPFEITDIEPTIEGLTAEVQPGEGANSKVIQFSLAPSAKPRAKVEYVNFSVKSGEEVMKEQVEVRVVAAGGGGVNAKDLPSLVDRPRARSIRPGIPNPPAPAPDAPAPAAAAPTPAAPAPAAAAPTAPAPAEEAPGS